MGKQDVDHETDADDKGPRTWSERRLRHFSLESTGRARCHFWKLVECLLGWQSGWEVEGWSAGPFGVTAHAVNLIPPPAAPLL